MQVCRGPNVGRLHAVPIEELGVVWHEPVRVLDDLSQLSVLIILDSLAVAERWPRTASAVSTTRDRSFIEPLRPSAG